MLRTGRNNVAIMAIFSLHHKTVGRTTHKAGTAGAHIRYICRAKTARQVLRNGLPESPFTMARWFNEQEEQERKNARMLDKIMVALPLELDAGAREDVVLRFIEAITQNRVYWVAAFHDQGKDEDNPHCHIAIYDRDLDSHKAVCGLSEQGSTQRLRQQWSQLLNEALAQAGTQARVDHRSLKDQGISRAPTIHEGVRARAMEKRGIRPQSKTKSSKGRDIRYEDIDQGQTRSEYNRSLNE
jgi:hypothetical protein